jgi:hypothetical protein
MSTNSEHPAVRLQPSAFPHLFDEILSSCPRDTLLAFRQAGREGLVHADKTCCKHVVKVAESHLGSPTYRKPQDLQVREQCVRLSAHL